MIAPTSEVSSNARFLEDGGITPGNDRTPPRDDVESSGRYLAEVIYGANDGIVTTFAVVSGVAGAALDPSIVIILGAANLVRRRILDG
jgi:hypothetical protein